MYKTDLIKGKALFNKILIKSFLVSFIVYNCITIIFFIRKEGFFDGEYKINILINIILSFIILAFYTTFRSIKTYSFKYNFLIEDNFLKILEVKKNKEFVHQQYCIFDHAFQTKETNVFGEKINTIEVIGIRKKFFKVFYTTLDSSTSNKIVEDINMIKEENIVLKNK